MTAALYKFVDSLRRDAKPQGISVDRWSGSGHPSPSIVELRSSSAQALAYVKVRNSSRGFWGLNPNQLRRMDSARAPWCLVLLHGTDHTGFFLPSDVVRRATGPVWHAGHDSEFKVNQNTVEALAPREAWAQLQRRVRRLVPGAGQQPVAADDPH